MYKIQIDTSDRYKKTVKLLKIEKLDNVTESGITIMDALEGDVDVVEAIKSILMKNRLKPEDIVEFNSNLGPGQSFTGLKIGATIANIFNWALNRKTVKELDFPDYGSEPNITLRKDL